MESLDMLSEAGRLFQVGDDQKALKSAIAVRPSLPPALPCLLPPSWSPAAQNRTANR